MNSDILNKFTDISVLLLDLEGVLIDADETPESFSSKLHGIKLFCSQLRELNLKLGIVTGRGKDSLTEIIEKETQCFVITSSLDKVSDVEKVMETYGFDFGKVMFIGDGILDIPLLRKARISAAPSAARREVKRVVDIILKSKNSVELIDEVLNYFIESKRLNAEVN